MKKYPVTYKGKEYEVRWEKGSVFGRLYDNLSIYEVRKIFKIKTYKEVYCEYEWEVDKYINVPNSSPDYYIEQVKVLFELWEYSMESKRQKKIIEENKRNALAEWDGVI